MCTFFQILFCNSLATLSCHLIAKIFLIETIPNEDSKKKKKKKERGEVGGRISKNIKLIFFDIRVKFNYLIISGHGRGGPVENLRL
jgi:hypothetical protein